MEEEAAPVKQGQAGVRSGMASSTSAPRPLADVSSDANQRVASTDEELDRVLGGGIVMGAVMLLGGEPGIGKSTLLLQVALGMGAAGSKVLYVNGEESAEQVRLRATRVGGKMDSVWISPETNVTTILEGAREIRPDVMIVDSVQTMYHPDIEAAPGSVSQIREAAAALTQYAKQHQTPLFFIGHITKEGSLAGPKVLEHMVDVVLQFEGEQRHAYRMLRAAKNRFGTTADLGLYEMCGSGLRAVDNPSDVLLGQGGGERLSGAAVGCVVEGARPILVEAQALVSTAVYGTPQRSVTGMDLRRLNMLLAVLEKRCGFKLGTQDVFLNLAGGLRVTDPALDLAVVAAVLSSVLDVPLPERTAFAGEVGLSGEIRPVPRVAQRIAEAQRLGLQHLFVSAHDKGVSDELMGASTGSSLRIIRVAQVQELHRKLFV